VVIIGGVGLVGAGLSAAIAADAAAEAAEVAAAEAAQAAEAAEINSIISAWEEGSAARVAAFEAVYGGAEDLQAAETVTQATSGAEQAIMDSIDPLAKTVPLP
jgi:hypothetical protein